MNAEFYLFDVDHGQSAALHLPNGRWCVFDVGCSGSFSPVQWIVDQDIQRQRVRDPFAGILTPRFWFKFLKATVSHFHGDHLGDANRLFAHGPEFIRTVEFDRDYLLDCQATNTSTSWPNVIGFVQQVTEGFGIVTNVPDYAGIVIRE